MTLRELNSELTAKYPPVDIKLKVLVSTDEGHEYSYIHCFVNKERLNFRWRNSSRNNFVDLDDYIVAEIRQVVGEAAMPYMLSDDARELFEDVLEALR